MTQFTEQPDDLAPTVIVVQVPTHHYWYRARHFVSPHAWYAPRRQYRIRVYRPW